MKCSAFFYGEVVFAGTLLVLLSRPMIQRAMGATEKKFGRGYLPGDSRQIVSYLPGDSRQIVSYLPGVSRQIVSYLPGDSQ